MQFPCGDVNSESFACHLDSLASTAVACRQPLPGASFLIGGYPMWPMNAVAMNVVFARQSVVMARPICPALMCLPSTPPEW